MVTLVRGGGGLRQGSGYLGGRTQVENLAITQGRLLHRGGGDDIVGVGAHIAGNVTTLSVAPAANDGRQVVGVGGSGLVERVVQPACVGGIETVRGGAVLVDTGEIAIAASVVGLRLLDPEIGIVRSVGCVARVFAAGVVVPTHIALEGGLVGGKRDLLARFVVDGGFYLMHLLTPVRI